jgi:peptidoglycan/xylan/chitin deacetylase (PgdA/CDA1 family)
MKTFKLTFFGLLIIMLLGCRDEVTNYFDSNDLPTINISMIIRTNDSTEIGNITRTNQSSANVKYYCAYGRIKEEGDKLFYFAPNFPIFDEVTKEMNGDSFYSINILVYKQIIFLKADDLINDNLTGISQNWLRFINYIKLKKIKASLGLIGNSLQTKNALYYNFLKSISTSNNFEIFNHGYTHVLNALNDTGGVYDEFKNRSVDDQKKHLLETENLVKDYLGILIHTFGAPGNAIDDNTEKALNEIPEINVWYYGLPDINKLVLKRSCEIEFPDGFPDYQKFINNYDSTSNYLALQIHPNSWHDEQFSNFEKIIDFLLNKNVTFMNPYQYFELISDKNPKLKFNFKQ